MKALIISLLLFISVNTFAFCNDSAIIIPIGGNCSAAAAVSWHGLRKVAYPFDWNITPFAALYSLIENDFADFLKKENLILSEDETRVIDVVYGVQFVHDFPIYSNNDSPNLVGEGAIGQGHIRAEFLDYVDIVREKYLRRIQRVRDAFNSNMRVILVRDSGDTHKDQAVNLYNLIKTKFPDLDLTLIVTSTWEDMREDWGLADIKNFYVAPDSESARKNEWKIIFQSLGIVP